MNFVYIGTARSGSTWLWQNLAKHPEVWVPPCKNINYFHPRFQVSRFQKLKRFGREIWTNDDREIRRWYRRFFMTPIVSDRWYRGLFPSGMISGEIAESYCSLDDGHVAHLHSIMPDAKVIFVLRNPAERALSQAKYAHTKNGASVSDIPSELLLASINRPSSIARSNYLRTLGLWRTYFPREQMMILFYDDLLKDSAAFLKQICHFLGVRFEDGHSGETLRTRANQTENQPLPAEVVKYAHELYRDEMAELAVRFGGAAWGWLGKKETRLGMARQG